ncbi:hypothetical protein MSP8886_02462 [Marinomonas spartinae]|uniref:Uncharacterized protein n=1 Tax=Marinomonas spartinae TaxID=1792290 RepID=A0A1A8TGE2_9GAMM|nr:hypothetical protein [Marinomonas spartinae]SBS32544.1 hypothetical protein MSP8886_02462 [Marinomonas spartinae]
MEKKAFKILFIVITLTALALISRTTINFILTIIVSLLNIACYYSIYYLIRTHREPLAQPSPSFLFKISASFFLSFIALILGYFSYWTFRYSPLDVLCRYESSQCDIGPYGWSVALLCSGASVLLTVIVFLLMKKSSLKKPLKKTT